MWETIEASRHNTLQKQYMAGETSKKTMETTKKLGKNDHQKA